MELELSSLAHGGDAIGREEDGRVAFIAFGLPGERVEAFIPETRRRHSRGRVERVLEASPDRVDPPCPYFGECGGCALQHARYPQQVEWKAREVEGMLTHAGLDLGPGLERVPMEDPWRYRIRGEFQAIATPDGPRLGFYRHAAYSRLPVDDCLIHHERIAAAIPAMIAAMRETGIEGVDSIRLTAEPAGQGLLVHVRVSGPRRPLPERFLEVAAEHLPGVMLTEDSIGLDIGDLHFRVRSDTFVQTNYRGMLRLYDRVMTFLAPGPGMRLWEGYGGIGTMGSLAAVRGATVTVVEENPRAVVLGRHNAAVNRLELEFRAAQVEDALARERNGAMDAVLLDPPRSGLGPAVVAALSRLRPERLVYVSCDPATLARDMTGLVRAGYRLEHGAVVDMFPHTGHVETVLALGQGH